MKPLLHTYQARLVGRPTGYPGQSTSGTPELRASKVEFTSLDRHSEGTVDRQKGVTRFAEIVLRPRLTLAPGGDRDRARWVREKSKKACPVTASLLTPVRVESDIADH